MISVTVTFCDEELHWECLVHVSLYQCFVAWGVSTDTTLLHSKHVSRPSWIKQLNCSFIPFIPETRHLPMTDSFLTHSSHNTALSKMHQSFFLMWQLTHFLFHVSSSSLVSGFFQGEHLLKYFSLSFLNKQP